MFEDYISITIPSDRKELCYAGSILAIDPETQLSEYNKLLKRFYKIFIQNVYKTLKKYFKEDYCKPKEYPQTIDRDKLKSLIDYWRCIV